MADASSMVTCPSCGTSLPAGAKFCLECGEKIDTSVTVCTACGAQIEKGNFCPECGHRQAGDLTGLKRGDSLVFGNYHGPITWKVLKLDDADNKALLISDMCLDCQPYNEKWTQVTWETCSLREWLNTDFYEEAFTIPERESILRTSVAPGRNPDYGIYAGRATEDKVFLLSIIEVGELFDGEGGWTPAARATKYAKDRGTYVAPNGNSWWRLRSPGVDQRGAAYVGPGGAVVTSGMDVDYGVHGIRPCIWIAAK